MKKRRSQGFTLIELMIVVAIIGILAAIAVPKFADLIRKSNEGATRGNLGSIRSALSVYYADMEGVYPGDNLVSLTEFSKYLKTLPSAKTPPHHADSNVVCTSMVAPCILGMGMAATYDSTSGGTWVYWEKEEPLNIMGIMRSKGDIWVGCQHTDSKGKLWSEY